MTTKQTTQLCYQVNGGTCRNKVSAKNYYICAAGHRSSKDAHSDDSRRQLLKNAKSFLEAYDSKEYRACCQILINEELPLDIQTNICKDDELIMKRFLASNAFLDISIQRHLAQDADLYVKCNLASNPTLDPSVQLEILNTQADERAVLFALGNNKSIGKELAIELASEFVPPYGYVKSKQVLSLLDAEHLSLINKYPETFGTACLERALESQKNSSNVKLLALYCYSTYKAASVYGIETYKNRILSKYPDDEELKILLS